MLEKAKLELADGRQADFDVLQGSAGPKAADLSSLYKKLGVFSYDPGFLSTASCSSAITYIDGDQGVLRYRGYDIASLVEYDFLSVACLLLYGELPDGAKHQNFTSKVKNASQVPDQVRKVITSFAKESHPMAILMAAFASLSAFHHDSCDKDPSDSDFNFSVIAMSQVPMLIAMIYRHTNGLDIVESDPKLGYVENFLNALFHGRSYQPSRVIAKALELIFILHADHEQNASTATVRLSGSAGANLFACLSSGVSTLWGPAHGGANEAVIKMLAEISTFDNIPKYILKAKDDKDSFRLMGFGHRVYKNYDPRAKIIRDICKAVLDDLGLHDDPMLKIAMKLEEIALQDSYFVERKLYPNVDFYSGIILKAIGIPTNMFTCIFALARTVGWTSQWREMMSDGNVKIGRPRQLYTGQPERKIPKKPGNIS